MLSIVGPFLDARLYVVDEVGDINYPILIVISGAVERVQHEVAEGAVPAAVLRALVGNFARPTRHEPNDFAVGLAESLHHAVDAIALGPNRAYRAGVANVDVDLHPPDRR